MNGPVGYTPDDGSFEERVAKKIPLRWGEGFVQTTTNATSEMVPSGTRVSQSSFGLR